MRDTQSRSVSELDEEIDLLSTKRDTLESEISRLEERIKKQQASLLTKYGTGQAAQDGGIYVFDDEDTAAVAFDKFFSETDPELNKIRDDLLKDSSRRRRFPALSARLGE